jgi:hypothetical protein
VSTALLLGTAPTATRAGTRIGRGGRVIFSIKGAMVGREWLRASAVLCSWTNRPLIRLKYIGTAGEIGWWPLR